MKIIDMSFNKDCLTSERINYLMNSDFVKNIICTPDFVESNIIMNGIYVKTKNILLPLFAGKDLGCGFNYTIFEADIEEVNLIVSRINNLLKMNFKIDFNKSNPKLKKKVEHLVAGKCYSNELGSIEEGNHFIELRKIKEIINVDVARQLGISKNCFILMIHSGASLLINKKISKMQANITSKNVNLKSSNGYEVQCDIASNEGMEFMDEVNNSIEFSKINRELIMKYILRENHYIVQNDCIHDTIKIIGTTVHHYKSVQEFSKFKGHYISLMPGDKFDIAYLLVKKGTMNKCNHGLPVDKVTQKYITSAEAVDFGEKINLSSTVVSLVPIITIKKINGNLERINYYEDILHQR